jgi:NDP-sugar pyrophosphorylase family protein
MKALLLTAGFGTRLKPLTFSQAKASLPLLNTPFVRYPLRYLHANHVTDAVLNLHAHPDTVRSAAGNHYGDINIEYSHEPEILGTAGAMRKAAPLLGQDPFIVMNGDMLLDVPLQQLKEQHIRTGAAVTLVIMKSEAYQRYKGLYFHTTESDHVPVLTGIREEYGEKYHYTGLQMVNPEILRLIPENQKAEIFDRLYPELMKDGRIRGYIYDGSWIEIGTLHEYLTSSLQLLSHPLPLHLQPLGMTSSLISPNAKIEEGAAVSDSIVMEGAVVRAGAMIERCIVGRNTVVTGKHRKAALVRGVIPWHF